MPVKIGLAIGTLLTTLLTLTIVQSRNLDNTERTGLTQLNPATEASAIEVFQSPSPDCDPVNDPSSCRY